MSPSLKRKRRSAIPFAYASGSDPGAGTKDDQEFAMANYKVDDIRNVALVGHGAAGKTSLADALLYKARAVERRGSVDDGTSVADYDEEEKARHFSIDTALLHLSHQGKQLHLLDTPGYPDFVRAAPNALPVVEAAGVVIA